MKNGKLIKLLDEVKSRINTSIGIVEDEIVNPKFLDTKSKKMKVYEIISNSYNDILEKQKPKCQRKRKQK